MFLEDGYIENDNNRAERAIAIATANKLNILLFKIFIWINAEYRYIRSRRIR